MQHKLIILGIILVGVVIFGVLFWSDLLVTQQEIASTPLPPDPILDIDNSAAGGTMPDQDPNSAPLSSGNDFDSLEKDLNATNFEIDSDNATLESEASAL